MGGEDPAFALAEAMPRALIESGHAEGIAREWHRRAEQARAEGAPALPRYGLDASLRDRLFDVRRARRLVRGLEAAEQALAREAKGLGRAAAAQPAKRRLSRLLVLSADGAPRFYRQVEKLIGQHAERLGAVVVKVDETELGAVCFGTGRRARAVLIDHKEAVTTILLALPGGGGVPDPDALSE